MSKMLIIPITKATLAIPEHELLEHLPREVIREGLIRGKAIKRHQSNKERITEKTKNEPRGFF